MGWGAFRSKKKKRRPWDYGCGGGFLGRRDRICHASSHRTKARGSVHFLFHSSLRSWSLAGRPILGKQQLETRDCVIPVPVPSPGVPRPPQMCTTAFHPYQQLRNIQGWLIVPSATEYRRDCKRVCDWGLLSSILIHSHIARGVSFVKHRHFALSLAYLIDEENKIPYTAHMCENLSLRRICHYKVQSGKTLLSEAVILYFFS